MLIAVKAVVGVCVVCFAVRQMFHDLFHPSEGGSLSEFVARRIFQFLRRWPRSLPLAGPLATVLIIFAWAILLASGFALIYWAVPGGNFKVEPGLQGPQHGFWSAFYFSLEVMTTLGLGDIKAIPDWLRVLIALHTLVGFALVTASLTWILLIFPAISRTNRLALMASAIVEAERRTGIEAVSGESTRLLQQLAAGILAFRVDLIHFPITYYFRSEGDDACMGRSIGYIDRLARQAVDSRRPERVRFYGHTLQFALEQAAEVLARRYERIDARNRAAVFRAYANHHAIALGE